MVLRSLETRHRIFIASRPAKIFIFHLRKIIFTIRSPEIPQMMEPAIKRSSVVNHFTLDIRPLFFTLKLKQVAETRFTFCSTCKNHIGRNH